VPETAVPTPRHLEKVGDCYEDAGVWITNKILFGGSTDWVLVHGRPTLQAEPYCEYGHAWLEKGDLVRDLNAVFDCPKDLYYLVGRIKPEHCLRYSASEVQEKINQFKHWGPWEGPDAVGVSE
jgi:hypothetical protein